MRHIPNILSSFRILLIPFFVALALRGELFWAGVLLIISGITDLLDGLLARRFDWVSSLGKVLDPIADKLTQITVCVLFALILGGWFWLFFAFLIFKELMMLGMGLYLVRKDVKIQGARLLGKVTTGLFFLTMVLIALFPALPVVVKYVLLAGVCICAFITGLRYIPEFKAYKRQSEPVTK